MKIPRVLQDFPHHEELETKALNIDVKAVVDCIERELRGKLLGHFLIHEQRYEPIKLEGLEFSVRARLITPLGETPQHLTAVEQVFKRKLSPLALPHGNKAVVKHRLEFAAHILPATEAMYIALKDLTLRGFEKRDCMLTERWSYFCPRNGGGKVEIDRIRKYQRKDEEKLKKVKIAPHLEVEAHSVQRIEQIVKALGLDLDALEDWSKRDVIEHYRAA